jgi:hypothetical protein
MRELHLWAARKETPKGFIQSLKASSPVTSLREVQGDGLTIFVHQAERNPTQPPLTPFVEKPLEATAVRANVGYIDAAPQSGTFKLKVGANLSTLLTWPADLSTQALINAGRHRCSRPSMPSRAFPPAAPGWMIPPARLRTFSISPG